MDENLLGYLLNSLDPEEHRQVETHLESHPDARARLEQLRQALAPLEADRTDDEPPPDLVIRTLAHVAEYCCRDLPQAPKTIRSAGSASALWRRADVLIAASILLLVGGLAAPWVLNLRNAQGLVACQNNLRQFHEALVAYAQHHQHHFPAVGKEAPPGREFAGMFHPILMSDGEVLNGEVLRCPDSADPAPPAVTLERVREMNDQEFGQNVGRLVVSYAYSLGYRDGAGNYFGPNDDPERSAYLPIMADRPPEDEIKGGNSSNHGRDRGQNVLYTDGHVTFSTSRNVGVDGDDIFLNKNRKVGAGLDACDTVLGRNTARP